METIDIKVKHVLKASSFYFPKNCALANALKEKYNTEEVYASKTTSEVDGKRIYHSMYDHPQYDLDKLKSWFLFFLPNEIIRKVELHEIR